MLDSVRVTAELVIARASSIHFEWRETFAVTTARPMPELTHVTGAVFVDDTECRAELVDRFPQVVENVIRVRRYQAVVGEQGVARVHHQEQRERQRQDSTPSVVDQYASERHTYQHHGTAVTEIPHSTVSSG